MGTHAMIGYWNKNTGEVKATYCHYDGYVAGVGATLVEYYNEDIVAYAISRVGYVSSLEPSLDDSAQNAVHKNEPSVPYESVEQFMKNGYDYAGAEYLYLWDGSAWFVASRYGDGRFTDVQTVLAEKVAA